MNKAENRKLLLVVSKAPWATLAEHVSNEVNYYLKMPLDAVTFSAIFLNDMLSEGKSYDDSLTYLLPQTKIYSLIISENTTGIYSYCGMFCLIDADKFKSINGNFFHFVE